MTQFDNTSSVIEAMWWANQTEIPGVTDMLSFPVQRTISRSLQKKLEFLQLGKDIHKYITPFIVTLGLIGNVCLMFIMHRPFMRKRSASVYFNALSVADSTALIYHICGPWASYFPGGSSYINFSNIVCKFRWTLFIFSLQGPGWLVVAVSFDRFIITAFPLKGKLWCSRRTALIASITIWVVFFVASALQVIVHGVSLGRCHDAPFLRYVKGKGGWPLLTLYTLVPSPLLIMLNAVTFYKLTQAQRKRKIIAVSADKSNAVISRATMAAVTVSVAYLILTFPSMTVNSITVLTDLKETYIELVFYHHLGLIFRIINNSINFVLYLVSYPRFRAEFIAMVTDCCPKIMKETPNVTTSLNK